MRPRVSVSLSAADPLALGAAARRAAEAGADALHVDIGDGEFVPWLGGGIDLVRALARAVPLPVDVHLMVGRPEPYLPPLAASGAACVIVHLEAARYPWRLRALAHRLGLGFGVALNPATAVPAAAPIGECADFLSLLATEPDEAGEAMLPGTPARVRAARALLRAEVEIEVDGGVTPLNAGELAGAGAGRLVVGRALLAAEDPAGVLSAVRVATGGVLVL